MTRKPKKKRMACDELSVGARSGYRETGTGGKLWSRKAITIIYESALYMLDKRKKEKENREETE